MTPELIMLGTGSAFPTHSYNSCFIIKTEKLIWLTDGGGGNGIFEALHKAEVGIGDIHHMFVTHSHTDHILGAVWILRSIVMKIKDNQYSGEINIYANKETAEALIEICRLTFLKSYFTILQEIMIVHLIKPGDKMAVEDVNIRFIDCGSENVAQSGYIMELPSGKTFAALGDEALTEKNARIVKDCDYLLCGAFCRFGDSDIFKPYEKHHLTVKDVAITAEKSGIKTLIITHSEDSTAHKKELYTKEAKEFFKGETIIPFDGETIPLK